MEKSTSQKIIDNAMELFEINGYDKTTINIICDKANVSKRTFYYHFSSKEDLLQEYSKQLTSIDNTKLVHYMTLDSSWKQVSAMYEEVIEKILEIGPDLFSQIVISCLNYERRGIVVEGMIPFKIYEDIMPLYTPIILKAQEKGEILNKLAPDKLYWQIMNILFGVLMKWCMYNGSFDPKDEFLEGMEYLCNVKEDLRKFK